MSDTGNGARGAGSGITILTNAASPYQVELFDRVAQICREPFTVIYVSRHQQGREWVHPVLAHDHLFLSDAAGAARAPALIRNSGFVAFGYYAAPKLLALIVHRIATGRPWAFWGERPGVKGHGALSKAVRWIATLPIRLGRAPIWGIGAWAVDDYRRLYPAAPVVIDLPYFSRLDRFLAIPREHERPGTRFLFSGSLIDRKGVDLLARAFVRLARERDDVSLIFLGSGPLDAMIRDITAPVAARVDLPGFAQWDALPDIYATADILVAPSRYDGWGLIVPEGLAAGMPVISTDRTGAAVALITTETGWLIPASDEDAVFAALQAAASLTTDARAAMRLAARNAASPLSVDQGANRLLAAIETSSAAFGT